MEKSQGNLIFTPHTLELADLPFLQDMGDIENDYFHLKKSSRGNKLKTPTLIPLDKILALKHKGLAEYIIKSISDQRPMLVPFVLGNRSLVGLARYFFRYRSASSASLHGYTSRIWDFSKRVGNEPDALIADVKDSNGMPRQDRIQSHIKALEDYVAELQDRGLSPSGIKNNIKAVKTLYRISGISITLPYPLGRKGVFTRSRAPTPEELSKLLGYANLREAVVVSMLALGGFREGTLAKLQYLHAKYDLERGMVPIHIHVGAEITKGKYHDYDTFFGAEAAEFIKFYLDERRRGSPDGKIPPEEITDESPLIRNARDKVPKPICTKRVYRLVHNLYFKAGVLTPSKGGYELKVHSLRKFFKTQLMALGVQADYIDYMMGHTIDTYNDIQMKGVDFLRSIYAAKDFSIRPKPRLSPLDQARIFCRGMGLDPEKVLVKEAFAESAKSHRARVSPEEFENHQARILTSAGKDKLKEEVIAEIQSPTSPKIHRWEDSTSKNRLPSDETADPRDVGRTGLKRRWRNRG